jgi:hypothetical protein
MGRGPYNDRMAERVICDSCGSTIAPHGHYIVRIDVFADPAVPSTTAEAIEETDFESQMKELMDEMQHLSADELQDQVHRRYEYRLCDACRKRFQANPLGLPRVKRVNSN